MEKFREGKIVVAEDYNKIVEILKKLKFNIKDIDETYPFVQFNSIGLAYGVDSNKVFYSCKYPLITLDTLKQWVEEDNKVKLVEKEFYYYETTNNRSCIFQLCDLKSEQLFDYYSYFNVSDYVYTFNINGLVKLNQCTLLRPATPEEIQLLKDKVKEQTGKVFNEQTKIFEEPKKEVVFKPFDKVLVRDRETSNWVIDMYRHKLNNDKIYNYACFVDCWIQCIPYEDNEHLLGTTNSPE